MHLALVMALTTTLWYEASPASITINPDTTCPSRNVPVQGRKSPLDSVTFTVSGKAVKVCYGRPSSRGRTMLGGPDIPYGKLWRTGANEPTIFFTPIPLNFGAIRVSPGVYSLYTVPGEREWQFIINRSISQWGREDQYTDKVKTQEVGRGSAKVEPIKTPVETFTIRAQSVNPSLTHLLLEWEKARVLIPVSDQPRTTR